MCSVSVVESLDTASSLNRNNEGHGEKSRLHSYKHRGRYKGGPLMKPLMITPPGSVRELLYVSDKSMLDYIGRLYGKEMVFEVWRHVDAYFVGNFDEVMRSDKRYDILLRFVNVSFSCSYHKPYAYLCHFIEIRLQILTTT